MEQNGVPTPTELDSLAAKTARLWCEWVGMEREDLAQEVRLIILKAQRTYNPVHRVTERAWIYMVVANRIKDFRRDAARQNKRLHITYIEESSEFEGSSWFEAHFLNATHDEVYGAVEDDFKMPASVTAREMKIAELRVEGYSQTEIAVKIGIPRWRVVEMMGGLRVKLAALNPTPPPPVEISPAIKRQPVAA